MTHEKSKVMIVEDEAIIALDIQDRLTRLGYTVTGTTRTAADAFQKIQRDRPDLVLMDIRIQGEMDGIMAANIIRTRYGLPVVYMTAHTDETTLTRAQQTQPFGYIVKPIADTSVNAVISMALQKHRVERALESHRKMLSAILQGLPDAVLVADVSGELLFINKTAEKLTGWSHAEAIGQSLSLFEIAPIQDPWGRLVTGELLERAVSQSAPVVVSRDSALMTRNRGPVEIAGQLSVTTVGDQTAGVFVTLQDVTVQRQEEQRFRQEQQMFLAGELAIGIAREFYGLFGLIEESAAVLLDSVKKTEFNVIQSATQMGKSMSVHLMDLHSANGSAHAVNVHQYMQASRLLLQRISGVTVPVEVVSSPDLGYVLSTGNHLEHMLLNLVFDGRRRLDGPGTITITADQHNEPVSPSRYGSYVRISVRSEKSPVAQAGEADKVNVLFGARPMDLGLTLVRAIVVASEGFTRVTEPSDEVSIVEVFLPRHQSRAGAVAATNEFPHVILLIDLPCESVEAVRRAAGQDVLILNAESLEEATLISELYPSDLDLIILNDADAQPDKRIRAWDRIRVNRPDTTLLQLATATEGLRTSRLNPAELERRVKEFLNRKCMSAIACAV